MHWITNLSRKRKIVISFIFIFTIIIISIGIITFTLFGIRVSIDENYSWNDGPWLTWCDDPTSSIVISWLSESRIKGKLTYSKDPNFIGQIHVEEETSASYLHHIKLRNLESNQRYYYRIDQEFYNYQDSHVFSFITAAVETTLDFKFCIVGDMQPTDSRTQEGGRIVALGIVNESPNFVLQLGDICSSGGSGTMWHNVFLNIPLFASGCAFQSVVGNHDYERDGSENYHNLFIYNYETSKANYYSFNYENVHFIMIDNFDGEGYSMTETQKQWVVQDIINTKLDGQKWIFICFHHTILTTGTSNQNWDLQKWLVPIADKYDIDGVFFGHDHHYEHWNYIYGNCGLLYDEKDLPSGNETHYWCSGGGGAHLEVDYGVLDHQPYTDTRHFYNVSAGEYQDIVIERRHWNASRYVDDPQNEIYAESDLHHLYYHAPDLESYADDNEMYGYTYGEQTLHYILVEISNNGNTCTISARYPNGELLMGLDNNYPQLWIFNK